MKSYILLILITMNASMGYSQSVNKGESIDLLIKEIRVKENTEQMMLGLIKSFMKKKPNAPKSLEQEIANSLDYEDYIQKVKDAYENGYTEAEVKELTDLHRIGNTELYKQKSERISQPLYDIARVFGRESVKIISEKLQFY